MISETNEVVKRCEYTYLSIDQYKFAFPIHFNHLK